MQARLAWEIVEILSDRFRKIPERQRPHYSPAQRFRALEMRNLLGWSREITSRVFLVCPNTVSNWEHSADPHARTIGSAVKPTPPVTRFADAVRATVLLLARCGMSETRSALELARAGWRVSERSVARIRRTFRPAPPPPCPPTRSTRPVVAKFVHHTWMMDVTQIRSLLGNQTFFLTGVFDAFSRMPLALSLSSQPPRACDTARLLRSTAMLFRAPRYVITDLGGEFTGRIFQKTVLRLGVKSRFASAENIYATARLERFWRTLKDTASLRLLRPLTIEDLERRLEPALAHYIAFRAHQGLLGATPLEVFLGVEAAVASAASPPRGRRGEGLCQPPFTVDYLDPQNPLFPVLRAAA